MPRARLPATKPTLGSEPPGATAARIAEPQVVQRALAPTLPGAAPERPARGQRPLSPPGGVQALQRTIGNQVVARLLQRLLAAAPQPAPSAQRSILDPEYEDEVFEIEAEKRRAQLENLRLLGGTIGEDDPRKQMLTKYLLGLQLGGSAGKRETAEAKQIGEIEGALFKGVNKEQLEELLGGKQQIGPLGPKAGTFAATLGERETQEAQQLTLGEGEREQATEVMEDVLWARALGKTPAMARRLLKLAHAIPGPEIRAFLATIVNAKAKLAFLESHIADFSVPFDPAEFDLFFSRPADIAICKSLLAGTPPWKVAEIAALLGASAAKLSKAQQSSLLELCRRNGWTAQEAAELLGQLNKRQAALLVDNSDLQATIAALRAVGWAMVDVGDVIARFYAKKSDVLVLNKFLHACSDAPYTADNVRSLIAGLAATILTGIAETADLQTRLRDLKDTWTDFAKTAQVLTLFHARKDDFRVMAQFLKPCKVHTWTQDNVKKLIDKVDAEVLTEVAQNDDLQQAIQKVSTVWTDWAAMGEVIQEGHKQQMTKDDKVELLDICADDKYTAPNTKKFIITAAPATQYTWHEVFEQVKLFRGHVQPAGATNGFGGSWTFVRSFIATNPDGYRVDVEVYIPGEKIRHIQDGHTYEAYYFSSANCYRSATSSMFPRGTDVGARAILAASGSGWYIQNAAFGTGPTQDTTNADYVVAFAGGWVIPNRGRRWQYQVCLSQLYPRGSWVAHELDANVAAAIGQLKGYMA